MDNEATKFIPLDADIRNYATEFICTNCSYKITLSMPRVELMKILIENSTQEGDVVLDPFMGVGSTGIACKQLNRKFMGCEIDPNYYAIAKERISNE